MARTSSTRAKSTSGYSHSAHFPNPKARPAVAISATAQSAPASAGLRDKSPCHGWGRRKRGLGRSARKLADFARQTPPLWRRISPQVKKATVVKADDFLRRVKEGARPGAPQAGGATSEIAPGRRTGAATRHGMADAGRRAAKFSGAHSILLRRRRAIGPNGCRAAARSIFYNADQDAFWFWTVTDLGAWRGVLFRARAWR